jgi:MoxR-like ATPase
MQERRVTIGETTYNLPQPFVVMATQNPIEQEGTYPLPEAQIDRFMMKCRITYPSRDEERKIMNLFTAQNPPVVEKPVVTLEEITKLRETLDLIYCDEKIGEYILDIVFATRNGLPRSDSNAMELSRLIEYGASPRATLCLNLSARALALIRGRAHVIPQDVKDIAPDVLRHRIILTYEAEAESISTDKVIDYILKELPVP